MYFHVNSIKSLYNSAVHLQFTGNLAKMLVVMGNKDKAIFSTIGVDNWIGRVR